MSSRRVAIICPNYYPRTCGVGDYSMRVGAELGARGIDAAVFTRGPARPHPEAPGVAVSGSADSGAIRVVRGLRTAVLDWGATQAWFQYTPHMLGGGRLGNPALAWLAAEMGRRGVSVRVVAHELYTPWSWRPDLLAGTLAQRAQLGLLLARADRFLVTTESRRRLVLPWAERLGRAGTVAVVPVGANASPVPANPDREAFTLGTFSTLAAGKRFDVILDAFARVAALESRARLVLVGDLGESTSASHRRLRAAVDAHPARERIRLTGRLSLEQVAAEVARLDVFWFPLDVGASTRSGTLPLALGSGLPVVAIRGIDTDDRFGADTNVVFADELTGAAFARAAVRLLREPALAEEVGRGARELYERDLRWPGIVAKILDDP